MCGKSAENGDLARTPETLAFLTAAPPGVGADESPFGSDGMRLFGFEELPLGADELPKGAGELPKGAGEWPFGSDKLPFGSEELPLGAGELHSDRFDGACRG